MTCLTFVLLFASLLIASVVNSLNITMDVVESGLGFVNTFTIGPDGSFFIVSLFTASVIHVKDQVKTTLYTFPTGTFPNQGDGILGIALDPKFTKNRFVYLYCAGEMQGANKVSSIYRFRRDASSLTDKTTILTINYRPTNGNVGGRLAFGPDGMLYLGTGDQRQVVETKLLVQDPTSHVGKILRIRSDGSFPRGNQFPNGVYAKGIRNCYGFTWDYEQRARGIERNMWATENGPECNDEINLVTRGANYGWGVNGTCSTSVLTAPLNTNQNGKNVVLPKIHFGAQRIAVTGIQVLKGHLVVGIFNIGQIWTFPLSGGRMRNVVGPENFKVMNGAGVLGIERSKDGTLFVSDAAGFIKRIRLV